MTFKTHYKADAWIVVADGKHLKVFEERRRHGPLSTLEGWAADAAEHERHRSHQAGTVHDRRGGGRHGIGDGSPADDAEQRFMKEAARRLDNAAREGQFDRLVLIAPPRALGWLRAALGPAADRVEATDPHERTQETAEALRERLRDIRLPA